MNATRESIETRAREVAGACLRLELMRCEPDAARASAHGCGRVDGTWIGGLLYRESERSPGCPVCGRPMTLSAQIDPAAVFGDVGLWCLYLCDVCLGPQFPNERRAHALVHYPSPRVQAWADPRVPTPTSEGPLVEHAWSSTQTPGSSFPEVEDFFEALIGDCPEPDQEAAYEDVVERLDPNATLSSNGCFFGERRVQIGGYVELFDCLPGPPCAVCSREMLMLLSVPNVPRVFGPWLDNFGMAVWACPTHRDHSRMLVGCAKFG